MLATRITTALILLILFLCALFYFSSLGWAALVVVMVMQGALEWLRLAKLTDRAANAYWWLTLVLMLLLVFLDWQHPSWIAIPHLFIYAASAMLWLIVVPFWLVGGWQVRRPLLMAVIGWVLLIPTGLAMMDLRAASPWWLLGVMGLVWMADIAAYFTGRKFGKHKLAPTISPGKTWEGVIGALVGVTIYIFMIVFFSGVNTLLSKLPIMIMASWLWVALAVVGDLFESAIKRQAGVKDSGSLLPGHGGLLDRIDALTATLPLAAMLLLLQNLMSQNWT